MKLFRLSALLLPLFVLGSCKPKPVDSSNETTTPEPTAAPASGEEGPLAVNVSHPSPHFAAVMQHLDIGGRSLHYTDNAGQRDFMVGLFEMIFEISEIASGIEALPPGTDIGKLVDASGMCNAVASGSSMTKDGDQWLVRHYAHCPEEKTAIGRMLGKAKPFQLGKRLTAATDVAFEIQMDGSHMPEQFRNTSKILGEEATAEAEEMLKQETPIGMTVEKLLSMSATRIVMGMELGKPESPEMPVMPEAWVMEASLNPALVIACRPMLEDGMGKEMSFGPHKGWKLPMPPESILGEPVMIIEDNSKLVIASSADYLATLYGDAPRLASDATYQASTNHFPSSGNVQLYLSPEVAGAAQAWVKLGMSSEPEMAPVADALAKVIPGKPWSMCMAVGETGMHTFAEMPVAVEGDTATVTALVLGGTSTLFIGARAWKRGADRSAVILNIRNCQQAMRGHQNLNNLKAGDSFTREDLEQYMRFPDPISVSGGVIRFEPGDKITPLSDNPATNGNHLWLKVTGPGIEDYVGDHGFSDISDTTGW